MATATLLVQRRAAQLVGGPAHLLDDFRLLSLRAQGTVGGGSRLLGCLSCRLMERAYFFLLATHLLRPVPHRLRESSHFLLPPSQLFRDRASLLGTLATS